MVWMEQTEGEPQKTLRQQLFCSATIKIAGGNASRRKPLMNVHLCASAYLHLLTDKLTFKLNFASELHLSSCIFVKF